MNPPHATGPIRDLTDRARRANDNESRGSVSAGRAEPCSRPVALACGLDELAQRVSEYRALGQRKLANDPRQLLLPPGCDPADQIFAGRAELQGRGIPMSWSIVPGYVTAAIMRSANRFTAETSIPSARATCADRVRPESASIARIRNCGRVTAPSRTSRLRSATPARTRVAACKVSSASGASSAP
jgi:hypothetical protein